MLAAVLSVVVRKHPDGGKLARFTLKLPNELRLPNGRRKISVRSKKGASMIKAQRRVLLAAKAQAKVRRGRRLNLRYRLVAVETGGTKFRLTAISRVR